MESLENQYGYDERIFVSETPDYFHCMICTLILRDPIQILTCGHKMCSACFEQSKTHASRTNSELRCPIDRNLVHNADVREDVYLRRVVGNLVVRCYYYEMGCQWKGDLRQLQSHTEKCGFWTVSKQDGERSVPLGLDVKEYREQVHLREEMRSLEERYSQDMVEQRLKNEKLESKIMQLTEMNKELQKQQEEQQSKMNCVLSRLMTMEPGGAANGTGNHGKSDLCGNITTDLWRGPMRREIILKHLGSDPSKINSASSSPDLHTVQIQESETTLHAANTVVHRGAKAWYEIKCSRSSYQKSSKSWLRVGWAATALLTRTEPYRLGQDSSSYAFSVFNAVKHSGGSIAWGGKLQECGYVGVAVDTVKHQISFSLDGRWCDPMGVAFYGIHNTDFIPAISGKECTVRCNFGEKDFMFFPPDPSFVALVDVKAQQQPQSQQHEPSPPGVLRKL